MVKIKNKKVKKGFELIKYTRVQKKNIHLSLLTKNDKGVEMFIALYNFL